MSQNSFSISYNWRSARIDRLDELLECFETNAAPLGLFYRHHGLNNTDFETFKTDVLNSRFCAAMYIVASGIKEHEGILVTKDEHGLNGI